MDRVMLVNRIVLTLFIVLVPIVTISFADSNKNTSVKVKATEKNRCIGEFQRERNGGPPYIVTVKVQKNGRITLTQFDARTMESEEMTGTYVYDKKSHKIRAYYTRVDGEKHSQKEVYKEIFNDKNNCISLDDGDSKYYRSLN